MPEYQSADLTLRIRFQIASRDRIGLDQTEVEFSTGTGPKVVLKSGEKNKTIRESDWLVLVSSGWKSEATAEVAAESLMDSLRRSLARHNLGADFGTRSAQGRFFRAFLRDLEEKAGRPVLNDVHGSMIYETEPQPLLARAGAISSFRTVQDVRWQKTFSFALELRGGLTERERTAFDLLSVAHAVQNSSDARFVLLFAALESLLEETPRPRAVVDHVDALITLTKAAELEASEKSSLLGTLKWLRSRSIRSSGRQFVRDRLLGRKYQDKSAEEFFLDCYDLRNRLMHGGEPFPTRKDVGDLVGGLDQMVGHLLAGPVLDFDGGN